MNIKGKVKIKIEERIKLRYVKRILSNSYRDKWKKDKRIKKEVI